MDLQLPIPQVTILTAHHQRLDERWRATASQQPYARWYLVLGGDAFLQHSHQDYRLRADHLYLVPPHTSMTYHCDDWLDICWFHFQARLPGGLDLFDYLACDYEVKLPEPAATKTRFAQLHALSESDQLHERLAAAGLLLQLLSPIVATADPDHQQERHRDVMRFQPVLAYIDDHLAEPIRIADLAEIAHLETTYFTTRFGDLFGQPPLRYLHQRRAERAMLKLWQSDDTLEQIAQELGYSDAFHFSRTFKKVTGQSPREFRRQRRLPVP